MGSPKGFVGIARGFYPHRDVSSHFVNFVIKPGFDFYWQEEYGVLSFGEKNLSAVVNYIHNQKKHHAEGTIQSVLEKTDAE